jgi:hypothetical protein
MLQSEFEVEIVHISMIWRFSKILESEKSRYSLWILHQSIELTELHRTRYILPLANRVKWIESSDITYSHALKSSRDLALWRVMLFFMDYTVIDRARWTALCEMYFIVGLCSRKNWMIRYLVKHALKSCRHLSVQELIKLIMIYTSIDRADQTISNYVSFIYDTCCRVN